MDDSVPINSKRKIDWYLRFSWLLVLVAALVVLTHYITSNINSCTSNPLEYVISQYKAAYGDDFNYTGNVYIIGRKTGFTIPFGDVENKSITSSYLGEIPEDEIEIKLRDNFNQIINSSNISK